MLLKLLFLILENEAVRFQMGICVAKLVVFMKHRIPSSQEYWVRFCFAKVNDRTKCIVHTWSLKYSISAIAWNLEISS